MNDRKRATAAFIDIDALLQDTWLQVISLRHGPTFQDGEGRTLWERCIDDVGRVQRELKASELDEASCQHILTAQCALLDEAVKGRGVEDTWSVACRLKSRWTAMALPDAATSAYLAR